MSSETSGKDGPTMKNRKKAKFAGLILLIAGLLFFSFSNIFKTLFYFFIFVMWVVWVEKFLHKKEKIKK